MSSLSLLWLRPSLSLSSSAFTFSISNNCNTRSPWLGCYMAHRSHSYQSSSSNGLEWVRAVFIPVDNSDTYPPPLIVHVSENAGFLGLSPLAMANIFSIIFGRVFNSHSSLGGHGMRSLEGARCYSASLYVTAFACFCALILAFVGVERDRKYR